MLAAIKAIRWIKPLALSIGSALGGGALGYWVGTLQTDDLTQQLTQVSKKYGAALAANATQQRVITELQAQQQANAKMHADELARLTAAADQAEVYAKQTINQLDKERQEWAREAAKDETYQTWANADLPNVVIDRVRHRSRVNHHH